MLAGAVHEAMYYMGALRHWIGQDPLDLRSDADRVRRPDDFVHLDLDANGKGVGQDPRDEIFGREPAENRAGEELRRA